MTKCSWHDPGISPVYIDTGGKKSRSLDLYEKAGFRPLSWKFFPKLTSNRRFVFWEKLLIIGIVPFLSCATAPAMFTFQPYTLKSPKIESGVTIKIVVIADLHNTVYGKGQRTVIDTIKELAPDMILLAGDLMDEKTEPFGTELLLAGLQGVAPMYYVTGNHEYMTKRIGFMREIVHFYGVTILPDTYVALTVQGTEIILAGMEDPVKKKYEDKTYDQPLVMEQAFRELDILYNTAYKILIAHRPEKIKLYRNFPFDLIVSGHAHGGQWRIARIAENGLYAPNQGFFPKYAGGLYEHGAVTHIVSRGLSLTHPKRIPRIHNPPELVAIYLEGASRVE